MTLFLETDLLCIRYRMVNVNLVTACLEGRWSQKRRLLDTTSLYRLIEQYTLVSTHAREKLLHAFFAPIGKSVHLKAKAGTHEVLYSQRVYLIDFQKGTVQDKNGRSEQRDSSTCQCTAVCALASCSAPVSHILPSRSDAQVALQSRKQTGSKHSGFTRNRTRPTRKSHPLLLLKKHPNATGNDGGDCRCAEKKGGKSDPRA